MQASFFRYILNWTLYRILRKIKRNESQILIIGKLVFLIRHSCHVLPYHVLPYHVLPCRVLFMSRSFLPACLRHVPSLSAFLVTFFPFLICPCHVQLFSAVLGTFILFSAVLGSSIPLIFTSFSDVLVILLPSQLSLSYYFLLRCPCHVTSFSTVLVMLLPSQLFLSCYFLLSCPCHVTSFSGVFVIFFFF